ncbi:hypothetical protein PG994_001384 [Apiospora phragmitis]|uniref:Uncharacterized protein n=1 Tax=Apiospora phragmitis TaxID=2905665 RepID=A0ABR1WTB7_9PEZI
MDYPRHCRHCRHRPEPAATVHPSTGGRGLSGSTVVVVQGRVGRGCLVGTTTGLDVVADRLAGLVNTGWVAAELHAGVVRSGSNAATTNAGGLLEKVPVGRRSHALATIAIERVVRKGEPRLVVVGCNGRNGLSTTLLLDLDVILLLDLSIGGSTIALLGGAAGLGLLSRRRRRGSVVLSVVAASISTCIGGRVIAQVVVICVGANLLTLVSAGGAAGLLRLLRLPMAVARPPRRPPPPRVNKF